MKSSDKRIARALGRLSAKAEAERIRERDRAVKKAREEHERMVSDRLNPLLRKPWGWDEQAINERR